MKGGGQRDDVRSTTSRLLCIISPYFSNQPDAQHYIARKLPVLDLTPFQVNIIEPDLRRCFPRTNTLPRLVKSGCKGIRWSSGLQEACLSCLPGFAVICRVTNMILIPHRARPPCGLYMYMHVLYLSFFFIFASSHPGLSFRRNCHAPKLPIASIAFFDESRFSPGFHSFSKRMFSLPLKFLPPHLDLEVLKLPRACVF